ncbi:hypothetical protein G6F31_017060 [Rhizopus arrhizus]|nr:hypothetical protein G6F31_017060 [Rhizopus arrhizus]
MRTARCACWPATARLAVARCGLYCRGRTGACGWADWRIDGGADLRQRIDLMRQAPDGTVWLSVMNLGLQQRSADGRVLRSYPLDDFRKAADSPIEQIRFDAHGKAWVMGEMGIWR